MAFVILICMFSTVHVAAACEDQIAILHTTETGDESIKLFSTDHVFYLPSPLDITQVYFTSEKPLFYSMDGASGYSILTPGDPLDLTKAKTKDERGIDCYRIHLGFSENTEEYTLYTDGTIASIFVTTSQGLSYIEANKSNRDKEAKILILESDGKTVYSDFSEETVSEIKGRGNATWSYFKKPYQIKLGEKTALLGMEKAKTWILLAGYTDQSALHNALAFMLAEELQVPYAIDYRFISLYIDGCYRGLYMICEKVQVDKSRVDIRDLEKENELANEGHDLDSFSVKKEASDGVVKNSILEYYTYCDGMASPADITGGYLVELDNIRGLSEPCHFQTENGNVYVVKSPEFASKDEMAYIAELFADMEEAIFSSTGYNGKGRHFSEYIDMKSFADIYTLQELLKNWDAYLSSMFFFKDADLDNTPSKIFMGPLWDMDNTLGNINFNYEYGKDTQYLWAQNGVFNSYPRDFAKKLMFHAEFQKQVQERYDVAYHAVCQLLSPDGWLERTTKVITPSVEMDRYRWKLYDEDSWLLSASGRKTSVKFVHFEEYGAATDEDASTALGFFKYYLSQRADALLMSIGKGTYSPSQETTIPVIEQTTVLSQTTEMQTTEIQTTQPDLTTTPEIPTEETSKNDWMPFIVPIIVGMVAILSVIGFLVIKRKQK